MPLTIDNLSNGTPTAATVEWADDVLHFTYNAAAMTGEMVQRAEAAMAEGPAASFRETCAQLAEVVLEWDLLAHNPKKGQPKAKVPRLPITEATLVKLPVQFVYAIANAIGEGGRPPEAGSFAGG